MAPEQCRTINTLTAEKVCQGMTETERDRLIRIIEDTRCSVL